MYSNTHITDDGAEYSSWMTNTCSNPIFVKKSEYKVKFKKTNAKGNSVMFGTTKDIDFPDVFLDSKTEIFGKGKGRDRNSSGVTFDGIRNESGTIGSVLETSAEAPGSYKSDMQLTLYDKKLLGEHNGIKFYAKLKNYDKLFDKDWESFHKYQIEFEFENTKSEKDKNTYTVACEISFNGIPFEVTKTISNLKAGEIYTKSFEFKFVSNMNDKVFIRQLSGSNVPN
ncbi:MAG: hypothetical protein ACK452_16540 [Bacteroidota bacterium]